MNFNGKRFIVTGASQGIGKAVALELARLDAEILLLDIQKEKLDAVAGEICGQGGKAAAYEADVSKMDKVMDALKHMLNHHKTIHGLVNNAGITRDALLMRMKEEDWDAVLSVNLKGVFNLTKAVIRHLAGNRYGRIVNVASVVGQMGNAGQTNYSASKAGVIGFTKSLAREVASRGITVNAVAPGYIATDMTKNLPESVKDSFVQLIPMKRFGRPEEAAAAIKFLLSDEAAYITGQVVGVNGGMHM
ncbi:MAG: 3-oxoacyl-[acyl-carrier-protein] reductase [Candidatus Aminicenantes bacterium]